MDDALPVLSGTFAEAESKDFSEVIDDSESAEDYGYHSDSDLEEDPDVAGSVNPSCSPLGDTKPTCPHGEHKEYPKKGKIIKIRDIAFITYVLSKPRLSRHQRLLRFQAFLVYLYTGDIDFAPYGSEGNRKSRVAEIFSVSEDAIPRPSPKSIYRLADKVSTPFSSPR